VFTLAHADHLIAEAGEILLGYIRSGPIALTSVADGDLMHVMAGGIAPLPPAVTRYAADALTQLRAALEHTVFAEVQYQLGRELSVAEQQTIEMPAAMTYDNYSKWLNHRTRRTLAPLHSNAPLCERIRSLQPYQRRDADQHPMRVLAEHTNLTKHRRLASVATLLGEVRPDVPAPRLVLSTVTDRPLQSGDRLVTGPVGLVVPVSIWPKVSIQRPHTKTWHVLLAELGMLADWVRTVAVPVLITGRHDVAAIPPQIETSVGHADFTTALAGAGRLPAQARATRRIQATMAREAVVEILALHPDRPDSVVLAQWIGALDDDEVLVQQARILRAHVSGDVGLLYDVVRSMIANAPASA
jgi:hypothetical protein